MRFGTMTRFIALGEIILVLAVAHFTCRAFHEFIQLGRLERTAHLNFSLGWTMALFAYAATIVFRRDLLTYGLAIKTWPRELGRTLEVAATRTHIPKVVWWCGLGLHFSTCIFFGLKHLTVSDLALLVAWQFSATALGEEVFFRGYAQSRLNEVFNRQKPLLRTIAA